MRGLCRAPNFTFDHGSEKPNASPNSLPITPTKLVRCGLAHGRPGKVQLVADPVDRVGRTPAPSRGLPLMTSRDVPGDAPVVMGALRAEAGSNQLRTQASGVEIGAHAAILPRTCA